jgi:hypothetical protein
MAPHPLARRNCEPWPLVQAGQIRPAPLAGAIKPGARPTDRLAGQPGRRQPNRRSGRDPGSRRYAPVQSRSGKPRQKHYPHSPCRVFTAGINGSVARSLNTDMPVRYGIHTFTTLAALASHPRKVIITDAAAAAGVSRGGPGRSGRLRPEKAEGLLFVAERVGVTPWCSATWPREWRATASPVRSPNWRRSRRNAAR